MSAEHEENREKFLAVRPERVVVDGDGNEASIGSLAYERGVSEEEVREGVAEIMGVEPDEVGLRGSDDEPFQFRDGRKKSSAAFTIWNSKWDPEKTRPQGDPKQN